MNILPTEEIPKNLELTKEQIMKERCDLVEEQIKVLVKEVEKLKKENDGYKLNLQELYFMLEKIVEESDCSTCDEEEEDDNKVHPEKEENEEQTQLETKENTDLNKSLIIE
jgi:hypothetical protein